MITRKLTAALACLFVFALLLLSPVSTYAQAIYGSIYGTVTDNTGASIPNATVTVTDAVKGTSVTAVTNGEGAFSVEHLIPDTYDIQVSVQGFKTYSTKGLAVFADQSNKVDVKLEVGAATQTVEVSADAVPVLKTDRADVSTIFDSKTVQDLPIGDRNFTNLQLLLPGAQQLGWSHAASENPQASKQIQVDGQAFGGVAFELDGTDNQDPILGIIVINPGFDSVAETKITTQNFDAEFGKAVSSVVTAQTKSGTNKFHGSLFDYRNSNANLARDPYTQTPTSGSIAPGLKSQFGGSIGGPVLKDKLFFFADYQGLRQRVGSSGTATIPSQLLLDTCLGKTVGPSGIPGCDFSQYLSTFGVSGTIYDPTTNPATPYKGNVIPTAQLSPQALAFLALLPSPTNSNLDNNYTGSGQGIFNSNQWDARGDYQLSERTHVFGRFSRFTDTLSGKTLLGAAGGVGFGIGGFAGTSIGANDSLAAGADIAINPKLTTDFRLGYYRYNIGTSKYDAGTDFATQLGIPGLNLGTSFTSGAPEFDFDSLPSGNQPVFGSGLNVNRCNCQLKEREDQFQIVDNWTKVLGNHSVKFGTDLRYARNLRVPSDVNRAGSLTFGAGPTSNGSTGGISFATFALGEATSFGRYYSSSTNAKEFQKRTFFYGQDTWRVTSNLTLNIGLRYEIYFPETVNAKGNGSLLDLSTGYLHVAGIGGVKSNMDASPDHTLFSPRLGIAYQLNPKTVIRSGYGRSYDIGVFGSVFGHVVTQNLPVLGNQSISSTGGRRSDAFSLANGPTAATFPTVPSNGLLPNPGAAVNSKARPFNMRYPQVDAWNLSIQRSLNPTLSLTLAYVGNKNTHTLSAGDGNNTNPNEAAIFLPASYSVNGQALHYDPNAPSVPTGAGATSNQTLLGRYYGGSLAACSDPNYTQPAPVNGVPLPAGACGWSQGITYYGDNQNANFNSLQVTLAKQFSHGLQLTTNYAWQRAFDYNGSFATWDHTAVKGRNNDLREQQLVSYGTYQLPFGRGKRYMANSPGWVNQVIGGYELGTVVNYSSGLPYTLSYGECGLSVPGSAPCYVSKVQGATLNHSIAKTFSGGQRRDTFFNTLAPLVNSTGTVFNSQQGFSANPLDVIGNSGRNTNFGPHFFNTDLSVQKNFPIKESLFAQFRLDAYNAFNHVNPGNPGGNIDTSGGGTINDVAPGSQQRNLQFSLRLQF